MCGKYHVTTEDENISFREAIAQLMLEHPELTIQLGDVLPSQVAPVYAADGLAPMRFGHRAEFMKRLLINARSETAHESRIFAPLLKSSRILVPARGFYEWTPQKKPFLFEREEGGQLFMAGLAFPASPVKEFVILTRDAVGEPGKVHDRMPVMFAQKELQNAWLHQDGLSRELLLLPDSEAYRALAG